MMEQNNIVASVATQTTAPKRKSQDEQIDLLAIGSLLLRKWWLILVAGAFGAVMAMGVSVYIITPIYSSQYMIYVVNKSVSISVSELAIGSAVGSDFRVIAKSKPVLDTAIADLETNYGKTFTRNQISDSMSIEQVDDTRVLLITTRCDDPEDACAIANALGEAISKRMTEIMKSDTTTVVEKAEVSTSPISPSIRRNTMYGFMAFAMLVVMILVIQYLLNDKIKTEQDIEMYLNATVLATLPLKKNDRKRKKK